MRNRNRNSLDGVCSRSTRVVIKFSDEDSRCSLVAINDHMASPGSGHESIEVQDELFGLPYLVHEVASLVPSWALDVPLSSRSASTDAAFAHAVGRR